MDGTITQTKELLSIKEASLMGGNTKYIFLNLEERNGEYEYMHRSIHELSDSKTVIAKRFVKDYLKGFYGGKSEAEDEGYYFFGGEIFVKIYSWCFISKEVFSILRPYL
jgi:hypothetical protein